MRGYAILHSTLNWVVLRLLILCSMPACERRSPPHPPIGAKQKHDLATTLTKANLPPLRVNRATLGWKFQ